MKKNTLNLLRYFKFFTELIVLTLTDFVQYFRNSFYNSYNVKSVSLRGRITLYYHAIEKGMSNENIRFNFGKYPLEKLLEALSIYTEKGYDLTNTRYLSGVDVVKKYIELHHENNIEINNEINDIINKYSSIHEKIYHNNIGSYGGVVNYLRTDVDLGKDKSFATLVSKRRSVRTFSDEDVDNQKIENALAISRKAPSACNRQPWKTYVIKSKDKIRDALNIQKGFRGLGENVQRLIVVTSSNSMYGAATERHATYIDGGLYAMTLLYALTEEGLATCTLNLSLNLSDTKKMKRLLKMQDDEVFIMAIVVGNYPNSFIVPQSERDIVSESVIWL